MEGPREAVLAMAVDDVRAGCAVNQGLTIWLDRWDETAWAGAGSNCETSQRGLAPWRRAQPESGGTPEQEASPDWDQWAGKGTPGDSTLKPRARSTPREGGKNH